MTLYGEMSWESTAVRGHKEAVERFIADTWLVAHVPSHTCYVEVFFSGMSRIFAKRPSAVEVINDWSGPGVVNQVRQVKDAPAHLLAALSQWPRASPLEEEVHLYREILLQWAASTPFAEAPPPAPDSVGTLRDAFSAPYRRMKTVIWEHLEWGACMQRYDDPRTVQIINPPWPHDDWDHFAALALLLSTAQCHWAVSVPDTPRMQDLFLPLAQPASSVRGWKPGGLLLTSFPMQDVPPLS